MAITPNTEGREMNWTRDGRGNYAPLITTINRRYYRVTREYPAWIVEMSDDREGWTIVSTHDTQRDAKASVAALAVTA
jgi:hypothetical protein